MTPAELQVTPSGTSESGSIAEREQVYACWNEIGVYGKGNCEELAKFIHCRNCPVYSHGAVQLLNRAPPAGYRKEWTEHFSQHKQLGAPGRISALLFRISHEWLALPTQAFQEVVERRPIHSLPHRRQGIVLGLANVRGELVICVSLGRCLGVEQTSAHPVGRTVYDRLLVINWNAQRLAFPVDEVHGIHRFEPHQLKAAPATVTMATGTYSRGVLSWNQHSVGYLDAELLFAHLNRNLT